MQLLNKVAKNLKPDMGKIKPEVDGVLKKINTAIKKNKIKAAAVAGGSYAKQTLIKDDYDIDIFVRFDYSYKEKDLSKMLAKIIKPLKAIKVHGSRDYFHLRKKSITFEIVPVLDIKQAKKAVNVTDMSPMHVNWVKKHLRTKKNLADDIRLAKQFCKANDCYGAESYIMGLSGHVLDILVIYYKGFLQLLRNAVKWPERKVIDYDNYYHGRALNQLNKSKTISPLIVIDPILPARNAAAAVNREKYEIFKQAAKQFLKKPSEKFFEKKQITKEMLNKEAGKNKLFILNAAPKKAKQDVAGAKLLKAFNFIKTQLSLHDFKLIKSGWTWDKKQKAMFWYIIDQKQLSAEITLIGPPLKQAEHVSRFKKKHKKTFTKSKKIFATEKRKYRTADKFLKDIIKDKYIKEKTKQVKLF